MRLDPLHPASDPPECPDRAGRRPATRALASRLALVVFAVALATHARADAPAFDTLFGLRPGATASDLERALGTPDTTVQGDDPVLRFAVHPVDPGEPLPATLDVTLCGETGRVCVWALDAPEARDTFARRAPVLGLLGLGRAELLERLGPPAESSSTLTWRATLADAKGSATLSVGLGPGDRATHLEVTWTVPTRDAPGPTRPASFERFAGLARGDREERVQALLGDPSSVRVDAGTRRLDYPGLAVGIDPPSGRVTYLSFGPAADAFLTARGIDEPKLWVVGKSPTFLRRHLGRSSDDTETWAWTSARAPRREPGGGRLTLMCGLGVVPTCDGAIIDWTFEVGPVPLPPESKRLRIADFARLGPLVHGDTEVELRQKLGEPAPDSGPKPGADRQLTYGVDALRVSLDPSGRIARIRIGPGAAPWLAERGLSDPRLAFLGRKRADLTKALGRASPDSDRENPSWSTPPTAPQRVILLARCYDSDEGRCTSLQVLW